MEDHMEWLRENLSEYEMRLARAEAIVSELRPVVANLQGTIDALDPGGRGSEPIPGMFEGEPTSTNGHKLPKRGRGRPFSVGNQNPNMPPRRPEFSSGSLIEAASTILAKAGRIMHGDEIARAVFEIRTPDEAHLAKRPMTSELYRGAKKKLWQRLARNRYRRLAQ